MPKTESLSLVDYAKKLRQLDCPVCQLDPDIRAQLLAAGAKGIRRPVQLAWLKEAHGATISSEQLTVHYSGKHDDA